MNVRKQREELLQKGNNESYMSDGRGPINRNNGVRTGKDRYRQYD